MTQIRHWYLLWLILPFVSASLFTTFPGRYLLEISILLPLAHISAFNLERWTGLRQVWTERRERVWAVRNDRSLWPVMTSSRNIWTGTALPEWSWRGAEHYPTNECRRTSMLIYCWKICLRQSWLHPETIGKKRLSDHSVLITNMVIKEGKRKNRHYA